VLTPRGPHPPSADTRGALRRLVVAAGIVAALAFVVVGLAFQLQTYGDGAIFSYAVAAQQVWDVHWRNIVARATVWLVAMAPAEALAGATGSAQAGVFLYGLLSFSAQAFGLFATFLFDATKGRVFFAFACASTACLTPLVFGFPSEMLFAHALFWPTFALAFSTARTKRAAALLFVFVLALAFTHEAALGLVGGIVGALALRGLRDPRFFRALTCLACVVAIWILVNRAFPPDAYYGEVKLRAAGEFLDSRALAFPLLKTIGAALAAYFALAFALSFFFSRGPLAASGLTLAALVVWWAQYDHVLHADSRYYARTILLAGTCLLAVVCALVALRAEGAPVARLRFVQRLLDALASSRATGVFAGAVVLLVSIHLVETAKFLRGWSAYRDAVRTLATGAASDPDLGAPFFVSSRRIGAGLNRLSWFSTTPYFSAVVADFRPTRIVIDPAGNYFWIPCAMATADVAGKSAVPRETREMLRAYACAHLR
jgi:hypothetical protein